MIYNNEKSTNVPKVNAKERTGSILISGPGSIIWGLLFPKYTVLKPISELLKQNFLLEGLSQHILERLPRKFDALCSFTHP